MAIVNRLAGGAIAGGSADLGHGANIVDREMIGIAGGQEFQRMGQAFVAPYRYAYLYIYILTDVYGRQWCQVKRIHK